MKEALKDGGTKVKIFDPEKYDKSNRKKFGDCIFFLEIRKTDVSINDFITVDLIRPELKDKEYPEFNIGIEVREKNLVFNTSKECFRFLSKLDVNVKYHISNDLLKFCGFLSIHLNKGMLLDSSERQKWIEETYQIPLNKYKIKLLSDVLTFTVFKSNFGYPILTVCELDLTTWELKVNKTRWQLSK